jgi:hypothetical protein
MMLFPRSLSLLVTAFFASNARGSSEQVPLRDYNCQHPPYTIHLFSKAPLVIYISNFLTPSERSHLQEITFVASPLPSHHQTTTNNPQEKDPSHTPPCPMNPGKKAYVKPEPRNPPP